jgi:bifunctional non-homologous end joining protein LigD
MLPYMRGRPVTMERYPSGIGGTGFMQKDVARGFPAWLKRAEVPKKGGVVRHPLVNDKRSLEWLANQNCITPHVWTSRVPNLYKPDLCVFDLDPSEDDAAALRQATLAVRDLLEEVGLPSWVKTSGSKGFHVVVPLLPKQDHEVVSQFAHEIGSVLVRRHPDAFTQEFKKSDRNGLIYVDTGRNGYSATFAAAYAVRPKPGAPVSAPCDWDEVTAGTIGPQSFTLRTMAARVGDVGDLWSGIQARRKSLHRPMQLLRRLV